MKMQESAFRATTATRRNEQYARDAGRMIHNDGILAQMLGEDRVNRIVGVTYAEIGLFTKKQYKKHMAKYVAKLAKAN